MSTKRLAVNGMLSAMCAVLGYLALDMGNLKITFETLPIFAGALLFGPWDGLLIGGIGTLVYQLLRYGVTVTTPLWILPYVLGGLLVGLYAERKDFQLRRRQVLPCVLFNELLITVLNTGVIYIDSRIFGYYSPAYVFGSLGIRLAICVTKSIAIGLILPPILRAVEKVLHLERGWAQ